MKFNIEKPQGELNDYIFFIQIVYIQFNKPTMKILKLLYKPSKSTVAMTELFL